MYPRRSPTTHTEQLGDEASVYDWARAQVHALNPTAARVWGLCDGTTSRDVITAALARDLVREAEAVVELTLRELARLHLLDESVESRGDRPATTRRWLLRRGVTAAMLPVICSNVTFTGIGRSWPGPSRIVKFIHRNWNAMPTRILPSWARHWVARRCCISPPSTRRPKWWAGFWTRE